MLTSYAMYAIYVCSRIHAMRLPIVAYVLSMQPLARKARGDICVHACAWHYVARTIMSPHRRPLLAALIIQRTWNGTNGRTCLSDTHLFSMTVKKHHYVYYHQSTSDRFLFKHQNGCAAGLLRFCVLNA